MSYTIKTGDLWESAAYITMGCKLTGIEPMLTSGRVGCQLIIEGENLAELQRQYFGGQMEARIFEFRRVLGYLHSTASNSKKKFQNILKSGATSLANNGGAL